MSGKVLLLFPLFRDLQILINECWNNLAYARIMHVPGCVFIYTNFSVALYCKNSSTLLAFFPQPVLLCPSNSPCNFFFSL